MFNVQADPIYLVLSFLREVIMSDQHSFCCLLIRGSQQKMPLKVVWNSNIPSKVGFFWLGGLVGKNPDYGTP